MTKHVLHVVERIADEYGGPARSIPYTAYFSQRETTKHSIASGKYGAEDKNSLCDDLNIEYNQYRLFGPTKLAFSPGLLGQIFNFARKRKNSLIHVHNSWNLVPLFVFIMMMFFKTRVIVSARGAFFPWSLNQGRIRKKIAWHLFQKRLLLSSVAVHVTSEGELRALQEVGISKNVILIPNGVMTHAPLNVARQVGSDAVLRLLFVSRIHAKKGVDILLEALASQLIDFDVELTVAGGFSDEGYCRDVEARVRMLPPNISVSFLGHVEHPQLTHLYRKADIFVLPSYTENFGIAIAEALSAALPVITTTHTPWMEVREFSAGYIIDTCPKELTNVILQFNDTDRAQRAVMSENAQRLIAKYDWRQLKSKYQRLYE